MSRISDSAAAAMAPAKMAAQQNGLALPEAISIAFEDCERLMVLMAATSALVCTTSAKVVLNQADQAL